MTGTMQIEKTCKNCERQAKCYNQNKNCFEFIISAELYEVANELEKEIIVIEPKEKVETMKNPYLYKTEVEDYKDNHKKIWRLSLLLDPSEWNEIKQYFKYYKNKNLVGWGTTSPVEVTEILTQIKGSDSIKEELELINSEIDKIKKSQLWGYEKDVLGRMDKYEDEVNLQRLTEEKKCLLGLV